MTAPLVVRLRQAAVYFGEGHRGDRQTEAEFTEAADRIEALEAEVERWKLIASEHERTA